jgi:squalene-hopene/tetraprenyl-beta-curcumene cyclase
VSADAARAGLDARVETARDRLLDRLLAERAPAGHWEGRLSSSALSTAVAVAALALADETAHAAAIREGIAWIAGHANADGGWGDTADSPSNLSTTLLAAAALHRAGTSAAAADARRRAMGWVGRAAGGTDPAAVSAAIARAYGDDRTFAVPILAFCAAAGLWDDDAWRHVPPLPFELAALPHAWFRHLRLPVVSYAIPALVAIGLLRHRRRPLRPRLLAALRERAAAPALRVLRSMQPPDGGFLEAPPLTGFVTVGLTAAGLRDHPVVADAVRFLLASRRADGSWPIDTDLATWLTTRAIDALAAGGLLDRALAPADRAGPLDWLLAQQTRVEHPFTQAAPGGWGWTDRAGAVPDADDTAGALVALDALAPDDPDALAGAAAGARWLLDLQNRDGGIPTFCRGWSRMPFDRSCPDLTAHALRAWAAWRPRLDDALRRRIDRATARARAYLVDAQDADGFWTPLWFGNQSAPGASNPVYGTAQTLLAAPPNDLATEVPLRAAARRAANALLEARGADGGWGGAPGVAPTVEETALALRALLPHAPREDLAPSARFLCDRVPEDGLPAPAPIGLYFAKLWYSERLYPVVWPLAALGAWRRA